MNKARPFILAVVTVAAALLAYGLWTLPIVEESDSEGFSASRVLTDIEIISKDHHSVAHPVEREQVRSYLASRLQGLGADSVRYFRYDSLTGPQNKHVSYTFDAVDILAEFPTVSREGDCTWLMLVAHYDSRYSQPMPKDTVWSYGAADDGYGVGVILETVAQVLKERENWTQGVKVLFTDAEEVGMMGMKALWENNREVFENVGLVINVEARGPWGPALLFETSAGNEKIMDLYSSAARYRYTYSLTTVVYGFMPNFTDFTVVKDDIPGMNFSTVADINHYHTDLDNFSNVSARSVQHYGAQIVPVAMKYLTSEEYSDPEALVSEKDTVNFTVPLLGMFNMSANIYKIVNVVLFVLFLLVFGLEGVRGRLKAGRIFKVSGIVFIAALGILLLGEALAWLCAVVAGATFKPFGIVAGIGFDNVAMIVMTALLTLVSVLVYMVYRSKAMREVTSMRSSAVANAREQFAGYALYGTLALLLLLSAVLVFTIGENLMFFIPLFCATIALILWKMTGWRGWMAISIAVILLHAFSFLYALAMALTIGAYGAVAMLAFIDLMVLIPMADIYTMPSRK
ncbi:MAG: M20/M25/M40 family metallo-hydrolase [Candidatus Cryptobacteroides sp.]